MAGAVFKDVVQSSAISEKEISFIFSRSCLLYVS